MQTTDIISQAVTDQSSFGAQAYESMTSHSKEKTTKISKYLKSQNESQNERK